MSDAVQLSVIEDALSAAGLLVGRRGALPDAVNGVEDDSRLVAPGGLFIAVRGHDRDGHQFLPAAEERGAAAAIVEDPARTQLPALIVRDGRLAAAIAASAALGHPARGLELVAVTGTNGKTTTVGMLRHLLDEQVVRAASIGTLGVLVGSAGNEIPGGGGLTTPGPVELQRILKRLVDKGVARVAMEVSSHALDQRRVAGLLFGAAVFTNLTRDHLDYHGTMEAYLMAKARLIGCLHADGAAVINADDPAWAALPPAPRTLRFGQRERAEISAAEVTFVSNGSAWTLVTPSGSHAVTLPLIGDFNISNALAAAAAAWALGMPAATIAERLSTLPQIPGRLERILERPLVLRDYSHTPDSLERALRAVRPFTSGRLIVVFGCGGDRDRGKRPLMGEIAERDADLAIVTSDNPRTEDPGRILDEIEIGMPARRHERVEDRRAAIARALDVAAEQDVILLAGKGHETYQIRGTTSYPFDEREIVRELASAAGRQA